MEIQEFSLEQKKECIIFSINQLTADTEDFICHCFSQFYWEKNTKSLLLTPEDYMHIIFPELFNELKKLASEDIDSMRYNLYGNRIARMFFSETRKGPLWYYFDKTNRINFLNDLMINISK